MNWQRLILKRFLILLGLLWSQTIGWGQAEDAIRLQDVVGQTGILERKLRIVSVDPRLQREARQLFSLHGGFQLVEGRGAEFELRLAEERPGFLELGIFSGGRRLWGDVFEAESSSRALAMGLDVAVQRMLGIPGFFSSRIAFVADRTGHSEIYIADIIFREIRQLTNDRSQSLSPSLAPDLSRILYTGYYRTGFPDIFSIDLRTNRREVFAGFKGTNTGATYSPDGSAVAMILSGSGNSELFISDREGSSLRRLTRSPSLEADPTWSPDGQRLALTSDQIGGPQIYTIQRSGREFQRVRTDISRNCSEPDWNPRDANLLAFTAAMRDEFEVAIYDFEKGESRIVTRGRGDAVHPEWLQDGRHLIYTERTPSRNRLMILDTRTGRTSVLSPAELGNARQASAIYP